MDCEFSLRKISECIVKKRVVLEQKDQFSVRRDSEKPIEQ